MTRKWQLEQRLAEAKADLDAVNTSLSEELEARHDAEALAVGLERTLERQRELLLDVIKDFYGDSPEQFVQKVQEAEARARQAAAEIGDEIDREYEELEQKCNEAIKAAQVVYDEGVKVLEGKHEQEEQAKYVVNRLSDLNVFLASASRAASAR